MAGLDAADSDATGPAGLLAAFLSPCSIKHLDRDSWTQRSGLTPSAGGVIQGRDAGADERMLDPAMGTSSKASLVDPTSSAFTPLSRPPAVKLPRPDCTAPVLLFHSCFHHARLHRSLLTGCVVPPSRLPAASERAHVKLPVHPPLEYYYPGTAGTVPKNSRVIGNVHRLCVLSSSQGVPRREPTLTSSIGIHSCSGV